ncbi:MAG: fibrobacter succinogenes major paralogous domain-containing protein [Flavobacteriales bacterium]|nr:fibrobacter succinogenes major paralogous domain-containing protein [Flavobacteriales bacterium]MDW8431308.1 hypothetical protein [Flavobacteriales bacterium]
MKERSTILFSFLLFGCHLQSISFCQNILHPAKDHKETPQILSQADIEAIEKPADGYWVFNSTTGCLNYYLKGHWHELCGTCLPRPGIVKKMNVADRGKYYVLFPETDGKCEKILIKTQDTSLEFSGNRGDSIILQASRPIPSETLDVQIYCITSCGEGEPFTLKLKNRFPLKFSPVRKDSTTGIIYRQVGALRWMAQDWTASEGVQRPLPTRPDIVTLKAGQNPCPPSWRLPSEKEWYALLAPFEDNLKPLLETPQDNNIGLGFSLNNMYSAEVKNLVGEGMAGLYWSSTWEKNKNFFASPRPSGYLLVPEEARKVGAAVRCVQ